MPRILITSGPTREYLDPVRYLSNASSGRMGVALAAAAVAAGHEVVVVTGPVEDAVRAKCPDGTEIVPVVSTEEMLAACLKHFPACDGLIAAAAPCDYRPRTVSPQKIRKTGVDFRLELVESPDIVARLAAEKKDRQWIVAFALETEDQRARAMQKLARKRADLIVVNGPEALDAAETSVEVLNAMGETSGRFAGGKTIVAEAIFNVIQRELIR